MISSPEGYAIVASWLRLPVDGRHLTTACTRRPSSVPLMDVEWGRG